MSNFSGEIGQRDGVIPVPPYYPIWVRKVRHPELEEPFADLDGVVEWFHPDQRNGIIKGQKIYDHLIENNLLISCLGLRSLLEIQKINASLFRRVFGRKLVFGWRAAAEDNHGQIRIPYLLDEGNRVLLKWRWVGDYWDKNYPALRVNRQCFIA